MAGTDKGFRCPNCGDSRAVDVGPGLLQCVKCGTQLPAGSAASQTPAGVPAWRKWLFLPPIFMLGLSGYYIFQAARSGELMSQLPNLINSRGSNYSWSGSDHGIYVGKDQKPGLFIIGNRSLKRSRRTALQNGLYLIFYSLPEYNPVYEAEIDDEPYKKSTSSDFEIRRAFDGRYYAILNKQALFRIDPADFSLTDLTPALLKHPELTGGKLKIDDLSSTPDALFEIRSSAGETRFYNPTADKLYATQEALFAEGGSSAATTTATVGFTISRPTVMFENAQAQLLRYVTGFPQNSPAARPRFNWEATSENSFSDEEVPPVLVPSMPVRSFEKFGPARPWYNARVLYWDAELVLLLSTQTESAHSLQIIQALSAKTGTEVFTLPLPKAAYPTDVVRSREGFLIKDQLGVLRLDNSGKIVQEIETY